ncbi:MAG: hypothetical protein WED04_09155 [Promethearchaeati archaeon SRVP18_Atabeyarchaeia-1]
MVVNEEWWRGFEDCAEIVMGILDVARDLPAAKHNVDKMLALVKEKKFSKIKEELGLL